jgi:hypothetical protein
VAIEYVHSTPDGNITVKWVDTGLTNEIHLADTITNLLVQDVLNACRAAEASIQGQGYPAIAAASGKESLGVGVTTGITVQLLGTWVIYTTKTTGVFRVLGGNLVKPDGSDIFRPNNAVSEVNIQSAAATLVTTGSGGGDGFTSSDRTTLNATKTAVDGIASLLTAMNTITEKLTPPGTVASLPDALAFLVSLACNLITESDTLRRLYNRAGNQVIASWTNSDPTSGAGGTFRRESVS